MREQRQMSRELLQIKNNQRQIEEKIFGLEKVAENSSLELPEDVELPFNTVEKLWQANDRLNDPEVFHALVRFLYL